MSKRSVPKDASWSCDFEDVSMKKKNNNKEDSEEENEDNLDFEDPFEDDVDQDDNEEIVKENMEEDLDDLDAPEEFKMAHEEPLLNEEAVELPAKVWRPGVDKLGPDELLDYEASAYTMLHRINVEWPALSFDILRDELGEFRTKYPATMYMVAGTQADKANKNKISILKLSDLHRSENEDEEDENDDESETEDDPIVEEKTIPHYGGINRIRSCPQMPHIISVFSETSKVSIFNISNQIKSLDVPSNSSKASKSEVFSFNHSTEGFALDWSPCSTGRMVSADCDGVINLWRPHNETWRVEKNQFKGHTSSVEDLQFSPNEPDMFISCSSDQSIRVWDCRTPQTSILKLEKAHNCDINVISWNRKSPHMLVSGADDGSFKVWNLNKFTTPMAHFKWHTDQICSIEWHPHEDTTIAVASADNSISIWDLALESDAETKAVGAELDKEEDIPPQLLFVHQGQTDLKELHFHPQIPSTIVSTAGDGFNVFHPSNM